MQCSKMLYSITSSDGITSKKVVSQLCARKPRHASHTSKSKSANSEEDIVALEPTGHASQWQRINCVDALSPCADIDHQVNSTQYAQMPGYCWPTKWKICSYRTRVGWSASQEIQDRSPSWIGDSFRHNAT